MIKFINAKINIGLNIVCRRPDGYHDLETVFYPVGVMNGTPGNPEPFCDILEGCWGVDSGPDPDFSAVGIDYFFTGRRIDCPPEKNLVVKAGTLFAEALRRRGENPNPYISVTLRKCLPDGAGLGGGSADASGVLTLLNDLHRSEAGTAPFTRYELEEMALKLGADCPVFVANKPAYAEGVGERLEPVSLDLSGWWCLIAKPDVYVSTREAFAGVTPRRPDEPLRSLIQLPVEEWRGRIVNDFESSLFPVHPEFALIKEMMYASGAVYASMSGSGSALYGLYATRDEALAASETIRRESLQTVCTPCLLTN
ncbi:MAG: 4-(cytidine 5'-diphospho)-2-C-methyl-D-erythritol kinase [Muribaculaceae bacterium]|nr:4-(cytidine 5'-diphospho)-2-C-methyl-D-erythritol kinase [Muribaculaceae bacterium]